jgi:hypothetical protein
VSAPFYNNLFAAFGLSGLSRSSQLIGLLDFPGLCSDISAKIENDMILFGKIENGHPTWSSSILPNRICHACVVLRDDDDVVALEC